MPSFNGIVEIQSADGTTIRLDGDLGDAQIGGNGQDGNLLITTASGNSRLAVDGATGHVNVLASNGDPLMTIDGGDGDFTIHRNIGGTNRAIFHFDASQGTLQVGAEGSGGELSIRDSADREVMRFEAATAELRVGANGNEGDLVVRDAAGNDSIRMDGNGAELRLGATGNAGDLAVRDSNNSEALRFTASNALLRLGNTGGPDLRRLRLAAHRYQWQRRRPRSAGRRKPPGVPGRWRERIGHGGRER